MDEIHRRVATRIRQIAREQGIPLTHLADRAAVGRAHLFNVLRGEKSPTVAWLSSIARALDVDVSELFAPRRAAAKR